MHEIFISYSRHDSETANALADTLTGTVLSVWLDRNAIQEGDAFDTQIEDAIAQTRVVIVIWSKESVKSHWVRAEAAYALGKHKLLPIAIDPSDPPLQFMQIQTIDFRYWDRSNEHHAFQQLAAALVKRLEPPAGSTAATTAPRTLTALSAGHTSNPIKAKLNSWLAVAGLRFPENVIEREFHDYFREKTFIIAQFGLLLGAVTYLVYGVADMTLESGGVLSTRFRFMLAIPLMVAFYGVSFTTFARRHSQFFICVFAIAGMACAYFNVILIDAESPYRIATGNGTMNAMLLMGFLALLPLTVGNTIWLGVFASAGHTMLMAYAGVPLSTSWLQYLHVSSMLTVACCIAYWRERSYRMAFAAEL